jgi:signal transduction histidine kinase
LNYTKNHSREKFLIIQLLSLLILLCQPCGAAQTVSSHKKDSAKNAYLQTVAYYKNKIANHIFDEKCLLYNDTLLRIARQHHDLKTEGDVYYNRVLYYFDQEDSVKATAIANQYLPFLKRHKLYTQVTAVNSLLIDIYTDQGMFEIALAKAQENYQDALMRKDIEARINTCEVMGIAYSASYRYKQAARYFDETIRLFKSHFNVKINKPYLMYLYILASQNYIKMPDLKEANEYLKMLQTLLTEYDKQRETDPSLPSYDHYWMWYYSCKSSCLMAEGKMNEAGKAINTAKGYLKNDGFNSDESNYYIYAIKFYIRDGKYQEALAGIDTLKKYNNNIDASSEITYIDYAHIYKGLHQYQKAIDAYESELASTDSISKARYRSQTKDFKELYQIDYLKYLTTQGQTKVRKLITLAISIGAVLIVALIIIIKVYHYRRKLSAAANLAQKADIETSQFLDNVSREIRNALQVISSSSDQLITEKDVNTRVSHAEKIRQTNNTLQRVIYNILDVSKISSDKMNFTNETVYLPDMISEVVGKAHYFYHPTVPIEPQHTQEISCVTDRTRLMEILDNLLFYLIYHTKEGSITLNCEQKEAFVHFTIGSTKLVLGAEECEKIFFRQTQDNQKLEEMGLDMVVCRMLVEKMDGTIQASSNQKDGTIIVFSLPKDKTEKQA